MSHGNNGLLILSVPVQQCEECDCGLHFTLLLEITLMRDTKSPHAVFQDESLLTFSTVKQSTHSNILILVYCHSGRPDSL